ncbi:MAG: prepilin-type N-terminal cleavage/methylation domain-containing protein [Candidatus Rokubacteria bacterium]|nr:prepilin-type N-terminal cleavage/methylation domain-containing protein [Candidatus Rokubacteria bacterium]
MLVLGRRLRKTWSERGVTMMEIIVVLAVIGVMAAVLTPMVLNYLDDAKKSKAESDVKALAGVIHRLARDVVHFPLYKDGTKTTGAPDWELLQGPGNDPVDNDGSKKWLTVGQGKIDELENHLIKNNPGSKKYETDPAKSRFLWRGPYIEKVGPDPWGNRYLVNIKNANPADNPAKVVWALTAGPNGKIETDPEALTDSGVVPGGDDIAIRIR